MSTSYSEQGKRCGIHLPKYISAMRMPAPESGENRFCGTTDLIPKSALGI